MSFIKGGTPWNKKIRVCGYCKGEYQLKRSQPRGSNRKYCSHKCYALSLRGKSRKFGYQGKGNPNWKGGISKIKDLLRGMSEYKLWRQSVFARDSWVCKKCGIRGSDLEAHHRKSLARILKEFSVFTTEDAAMCRELWNVGNGETLCKRCHKNDHMERS